MIAWMIETLVATTLLMALVLALRGPVRRAFGANMAYALWTLPVLRMLLPPLPAAWREQAAAPVAAATEVITYYVVEPLSSTPAAAAAPIAAASTPPVSAFDWLAFIGTAWAIGAAGFLLYHLVAHRRFCGQLLRRARVDRTVAEGRVRVIETDAAHGPLAFGIWRKYVAFPRDFTERYDEVERDLALAHELGHHIRGDLVANWVALVVLAIHWFNPVAWRAFRAFRADQEMACDALVLAGREAALRHAYGRAIVKSAHGGAVSAACHLHTINEIKGRLRMLSKTQKFSPARIGAGIAGVSALTLVALGVTASGSQAAERLKTNVERTIGVHLPSQELPAPPAAPAAPVAPEGPAAAAVPAAPAAPAAPEAPKPGHRVFVRTMTADGEKKPHHVVIVRDGQQVSIDGEELASIETSIPEIRSGDCPGSKPVEETQGTGGKHKIVICTNVIARVTADATAMAERSRKAGMESAMVGLRQARAAIEAQRDLSAAQRAQALAGIDQAIAEVRREGNKD